MKRLLYIAVSGLDTASCGKKSTATSPQTRDSTYNRLRLEHGKQIVLRDNQNKPEAIALTSGFNSLRTCDRPFRHKYRVTPNEYIIITNK